MENCILSDASLENQAPLYYTKTTLDGTGTQMYARGCYNANSYPQMVKRVLSLNSCEEIQTNSTAATVIANLKAAVLALSCSVKALLRSSSSTFPPGKTHIPSANESLVFLLIIKTSTPWAESRMGMTVEAGIRGLSVVVLSANQLSKFNKTLQRYLFAYNSLNSSCPIVIVR